MDRDTIYTFGFGKAVKTGKFGTPWVRFHITELPDNSYEISTNIEPEFETLQWAVSDNILTITDTYYHLREYPNAQTERYTFTIPSAPYIQIIFKQEDRFFPSDEDEAP